MSNLGNHPVTNPILEAAITDNRALLNALACRYGVLPQDLGDVIQEALLAVSKLSIRGDLLAILQSESAPIDPSEISRIITALLVVYLKFACRNYLRKRDRDRHKLPDSETIPVVAAMSEVLITLFPHSEVDVEAVLRGDSRAFGELCEAIYDRAGLNPQEREYARFKEGNPEAREKDFSKSLPAYRITRIRQTALKKVRYFLETGQPLGGSAGG